MDDGRTIVISAGPPGGGRSLAQRAMTGLWILAAMGAAILIVALGLALALLLIPAVMIAGLLIWLRLRLRAPSGRRNVRVIRR